MSIEETTSMETTLCQLLQKKKRDFITLTALRDGLPLKSLQALKLHRKSAVGTVEKAIKTHLGSSLMITVGYRQKRFLAFKLPPAHFILQKIANASKPPTPGLISRDFLYSATKLTALLNTLLMEKALFCTFKNLRDPPRFLISETSEEKKNCKSLPESDRRANNPESVPRVVAESPSFDKEMINLFAEQFKKLDQGRNFLRIHSLRAAFEALGWSKADFDQAIAFLRDRRIIELQGGDPTQLSPQALKNAFLDENGIQFLNIRWREKT
ncbi:hypothetical protein ACQZV8_14795 [Magnetococcales bacterium HHB-1]